MKYRDVFSTRHTLLAVVHAESEEQALRNTTIARDNGADGVFLINHTLDAKELLACYRRTRKVHSTWWIGLNFLDLKPEDAIVELPRNANALWTDSVPRGQSAQEGMFRSRLSEKRKRWHGLYFGGVAFKGQAFVPDVRKAAADAVSIMDVITTSGNATGSAPPVEKIQRIREGAGTHPVAIASGTSAENASTFKPYADVFMAASSIGASFTELDPVKVRAFADALSS